MVLVRKFHKGENWGSDRFNVEVEPKSFLLKLKKMKDEGETPYYVSHMTLKPKQIYKSKPNYTNSI